MIALTVSKISNRALAQCLYVGVLGAGKRMAVCDYCGTTYRGGAAVHGKLRFCTHQCRDRGRILELLDSFPPAAIDEQIESERVGPCAECGARANIDIHKSHKVYSALVWTFLEDAVTCLLPIVRAQTPDESDSLLALARLVGCALRPNHNALPANSEHCRHAASRRPSFTRFHPGDANAFGRTCSGRAHEAKLKGPFNRIFDTK